jgi:hypothetical protein
MDDNINRLARKLAEAIGRAVAKSSEVANIREEARTKGFQVYISLEAEIGFGAQAGSQEPTETTSTSGAQGGEQGQIVLSANDRRFLRSLRIGTDKLNQEVKEKSETIPSRGVVVEPPPAQGLKHRLGLKWRSDQG